MHYKPSFWPIFMEFFGSTDQLGRVINFFVVFAISEAFSKNFWVFKFFLDKFLKFFVSLIVDKVSWILSF